MESGILITNIKNSVDERLLRNTFENIGKILYLHICMDKFNPSTKICYINYSSVEEAMKTIEKFDKTFDLGEPLRISFKKITQNSDKSLLNGNMNKSVTRMQSFGRGRGMVTECGSRVPRSIPSCIVLSYINIPLNTKIRVEIVELKDVNNILARPLILTEDSKPQLTDILDVVNDNVHTLADIRVPEINCFYMAKWAEDNNFYRAKLLEKSGNNLYKVCFVDEGTSGDIVKELKEIPKEVADVPSQFLPCDMQCESSEELINLIISNGNNSQVNIFVTNGELIEGKYRINLFLNDIDVIELYKSKYNRDPRINKMPNESDLERYKLNSEFSNFQLINYPKKHRDIFKIALTDAFSINPKIEPLCCSPIPGDVLIYRQSENYLHRCVIESTRFINDTLNYGIRLVDENRSLETTSDSLFQANFQYLKAPPRVINCVTDLTCDHLLPSDEIEKIIIEDIDQKKNLYAITVIKAKPIQNLIGQRHSVILSHVESCDEFYIRFSDNATSETINQIQDILNSNYPLSGFSSIRDLSKNEIVIAPFMEENYRAMVKEINSEKSLIYVFFIDFGNYEWVKLNDLIRLKDNMKSLPPVAKRCQLPVKINSKNNSDVGELLMEYCENGRVEVSVDVISDSDDILTVNLFAENKKDFVEVLKSRNLSNETSKDVDVKKDLIARILDLEKRISSLERYVNVNSK